ncbi:hypothetical protein DFQ12_1989 [Sphingobacterium detergens]|uniref:Uncharacterized protein n=1 Tax=Sphingobacterium detergens TaxID=1145106 RepID=A0A420BK66_SPHD1|nr:hypothetical protein DFQ12_1989 [Sphingobacterium detergens]
MQKSISDFLLIILRVKIPPSVQTALISLNIPYEEYTDEESHRIRSVTK